MTFTTVLLLLATAVVIAAVAYAFGRQSAPPTASQTPPTIAPRPTAANHEPAMPRKPPATQPAPVSAKSGKVTVRSWGYQLQDLDVAYAAASPFDLLVVDPAKDGDDESALTPAEVSRLKSKPDGSRRLVLAYLSIGEAESYRGYWRPEWKSSKPSWLLAENPEWKENYAVCFWDPGWQALMYGAPGARLDQILAAGFDGVYLDKCDVFEDMREHKMKEAKSRPDLEGDMVQFITRLSRHAKSKQPDFLVVMQNAESLLEKTELRRVLDGCGKEELVFGLSGSEKRNSEEEITWAREQFDLMKREGKLVMVIEYLNTANKIAEARDIVSRLGYTLYVSPKNRDLKKLVYPPPAGDATA